MDPITFPDYNISERIAKPSVVFSHPLFITSLHYFLSRLILCQNCYPIWGKRQLAA